MIKHDVSSLAEIGTVIMREQAVLLPGTEVKIQFFDGSSFLGSLTISRAAEQDHDDLAFLVSGVMYSGGRDIPISIVCEPDGPASWPICHNGRIYNDDEPEEYGNQTRAQFYADGPGWNADNAPKVKPVFHCATTRAGEKLASTAGKVEAAWEKGRAQVKVDNKLTWFSAKDLLQAGPETDIWPRPMPKPQRAIPSEPQKEKGKAKRVKSGVHKRLSTGEKVAVYG